LDRPAFFRFGNWSSAQKFQRIVGAAETAARVHGDLYTTDLALGAVLPAAAQSYPNPNRQLKFVAPYQAGGATDVVARLVATKLSESWKQPVVVENPPGGGGIVGNDMVAKALPDGYMVLFAITQLIPAPALGFKVPYDVLKDFTPVTQCEVNPSCWSSPVTRQVAEGVRFDREIEPGNV